MTLLKTGALNGIAVLIKMLTLLAINKILAVYVGPAGYAALGQFQNAVQMITTFSSGAITTGVTKYTAEYHADYPKQRRVWQTAGTIALVGSLIAAIVISIFSKALAGFFLKDPGLNGVFIWFAATVTLFTFNALLLAILNGRKEILLYVSANIAGSIFALLVTGLMTTYYGLYGALVALAVYQSLSFFITLFLCMKTDWFHLSDLFGSFDREISLNLAKFTAMALTSAVSMPVCQILIRDYLGETLSWEAAGYWEAMWRLSAAYLMLVTTTLSVYYLPRLSEIKGFKEIKIEILNGYYLIIPVTILAGAVVYFSRDIIIEMLFSQDFSPMRDLFGWQIVGDVMKICSWIFAYVMLGKAMFKLFMVTEVIFSIVFYLLVRVFCEYFGLQGVAMAYATNYALYWVVISICVIQELKKNAATTSAMTEKL